MPILKATDQSLPADVRRHLQRLGQSIKLSRKRRDMTQAMLAQAMFTTRQTVARLERGDPAIAWSTFLLAIFCLQRKDELENFLTPEQDRLGMALGIQKQAKRQLVRQKKEDDLDF